MRLEDWLSVATKKLTDSGIDSARLDCLILLEDVSGRDRSWLLAHLEEKLNKNSLQNLNKKLARRSTHEPLAYIRRITEFYGRRFVVDKRVLEPRPETEIIIELLKKLPFPGSSTIIDIGTGCGALAITAKLELPETKVIASDIDPVCLKVARSNAQAHKVRIKFFRGDLLEPLRFEKLEQFVLLANLPYVPNNFPVNQAAAREPRHAIAGGSDGLDYYRRMFHQLTKFNPRPRFILTESLPFQHRNLVTIAKKKDFQLQSTQDFIQIFSSY